MKLRTAFFCRKCDEEIVFGEVTVLECSHCGFTGGAFDSSIFYEWKVEVPAPFKKIEAFKEGDSCSIEKHENIKTVSTKGRRVSDR